MKKQTAILLLILVTVIWGGGFVAIKLTLDAGISAGVLNMIRGLLFSVLVLMFFPREVVQMSPRHLKNGIWVGIFNFLGFLLQAIGAVYTTPSNSAFLTTTNVVMVPFLAWAVYKIRPKVQNLLAVVVCMAGMAFLTDIFAREFVLNIGDVYTVAGALFFALSIVMLAKQPRGAHFAAGAFLMGVTLFLGSTAYAFIVEGVDLSAVNWKSAVLPVLYLAVGSNFIAQSLQIEAQKYLTASTASLVMMLEGVFGSVFSILFGYEDFTFNLVLGGGLILCSLVLSEMRMPKKKKRNVTNSQDRQ